MPKTSKMAEAREKPWDNSGAVAFSHGMSSPLSQTLRSLLIKTSINKIDRMHQF
jgi:hypothetical protein